MNPINHSKRFFLTCCLTAVFHPLPASARQSEPPVAPIASERSGGRDGQHDFDFEIGHWKMHVARRVHPLTGSNAWVEYDGTVAVREVWDGRGNLEEIKTDGPTGPLEFLSLRLYNPASREWSLNVASSRDGTLRVPLIGGFKDGRGEFFTDQEKLDGRPIRVRFVISNITSESCHFEQAFLSDGGKAWETNFTATFARIHDEPK